MKSVSRKQNLTKRKVSIHILKNTIVMGRITENKYVITSMPNTGTKIGAKSVSAHHSPSINLWLLCTPTMVREKVWNWPLIMSLPCLKPLKGVMFLDWRSESLRWSLSFYRTCHRPILSAFSYSFQTILASFQVPGSWQIPTVFAPVFSSVWHVPLPVSEFISSIPSFG